jgi:(2Fe-2S) ferredoxin
MVVVYDGEGTELWYDYVDAEDMRAYTLEGVLEGEYVLQIAEAFGSYVFEIAQ